MAKVHKVYPSFYNGISQQIPELMHDSNCKDMVNCIPDLVLGASKRPPAKYITHNDLLPTDSKIIHTYDRGEGDEEYIFVATGDVTDPLKIFDSTGALKTIDYGTSGTSVKDYLTPVTLTRLKGLTVQDRTFLVNKENEVGVNEIAVSNPIFQTTAQYTSVIATYTSVLLFVFPSLYAYNLDVTAKITVESIEYTRTETLSTNASTPTLDVTAFANTVLANLITALSIVGIETFENTLTSGTEFTTSLDVEVVLSGTTANHLSSFSPSVIEGVVDNDIIPTAFYWIKRSSADINNEFRYAIYLDGVKYETVDDQSDVAVEELVTVINLDVNWIAESLGNVIKIHRTDLGEFTFSSWDSWGDEASFGWKGAVAKLSDLPAELGFEGELVQITGDDKNAFTDYWVVSTGSSWLETRAPSDKRGTLSNMPIACDRQADGTFLLSIIDWDIPKVGDTDTNPTPSFVGQTLNDVFFYKNRLGIASRENVVMSETGGYYNFFIKTVLEVLDSDPIDIALASTTASQIQYVKPFQGSLFLFTKEGQFEMISSGITSPLSVSIESVSSYPMAVDVEPVVSGNSLFFISITNNKQQLREYRKNNDTLNVSGIDLNITTPDLIDVPIKKILVNGVLGFVFVTTYTNEVFLYSYKENSQERVQSGFSRWKFYENLTVTANSYEYEVLNNLLIVVFKVGAKYSYNAVDLTKEGETVFADTSDLGQHPYESRIQLPSFYPHLTDTIGSPKDKILLKKLTIEGDGSFDAELYRKDYDKTYSKSHLNTDIQDLDFHINSKVGNCELYITDSTLDDFTLRSFILEGLFNQTSKQIR